MVRSIVLSLVVATSFSGTTFAANMMTSSEMATMHKCQAMSEAAMHGNKKCVRLMKKYPDGMQGNSMDNGGMNKQ